LDDLVEVLFHLIRDSVVPSRYSKDVGIVFFEFGNKFLSVVPFFSGLLSQFGVGVEAEFSLDS